MATIRKECYLMNATAKSSSVEFELKVTALEAIYTKYSKKNRIHMYSDASKIFDKVGVCANSEHFAF